MNTRDVRRWPIRLGLLGAATLLFTACPERADEITEDLPPAFNFAVASVWNAPQDTFTVNEVILIGFDPTVRGAFARSWSTLGLITDENPFGLDAINIGHFEQEDLEVVFGKWSRNFTEDPRLPLLASDETGLPGTSVFCQLFPPAVFENPGQWDFFCRMAGLKPNTQYTVALVGYTLTVNGELDATQIMLGDPVTDPDELQLLNPNPGGYPDVQCNFTVGTPVLRTLNPFVLGWVETDAGGNVDIDCVPFSVSSDATWWRNDEDTPPDGAADSLPFVPNNFGARLDFLVPSYNYIVLVEGVGDAANPMPAGPAAVRWQVGPDVDASNSVINNAFAPFPTSARTTEQLAGAPGGAVKPDSIIITFNQLEELAGGAAYTAWLFNETSGDFIPAQGTYRRFEIVAERDPISGEILSTEDVLREEIAGASSFAGGTQGDAGARHQLIVSDATLPGGAQDTVGFYTHLILSADDAPGDGSPSNSVPIFALYDDKQGTLENFADDIIEFEGSASIGNLNNIAGVQQTRVFSGSGLGLGGFRSERGPDDALQVLELSVDLEAMSRPPIGYQYVGWLVPSGEGEPFRLPPITGPPPQRIDLTNADVNTDPGVVTQTGILEANFTVTQDAGVNFGNFGLFVVTLEPKVGAPGMGPLRVFSGTVPDQIQEIE